MNNPVFNIPLMWYSFFYSLLYLVYLRTTYNETNLFPMTRICCMYKNPSILHFFPCISYWRLEMAGWIKGHITRVFFFTYVKMMSVFTKCQTHYNWMIHSASLSYLTGRQEISSFFSPSVLPSLALWYAQIMPYAIRNLFTWFLYPDFRMTSGYTL